MRGIRHKPNPRQHSRGASATMALLGPDRCVGCSRFPANWANTEFLNARKPSVPGQATQSLQSRDAGQNSSVAHKQFVGGKAHGSLVQPENALRLSINIGTSTGHGPRHHRVLSTLAVRKHLVPISQDTLQQDISSSNLAIPSWQGELSHCAAEETASICPQAILGSVSILDMVPPLLPPVALRLGVSTFSQKAALEE